MATSQRVQILTDKSQELEVIFEFFKNPKLIDQLKEEVIALNKLTIEEEARLHDARLLMEKKDRLEKDIEDGRRVMAKEKSDHEVFIKNGRDNLDRIIGEEKVKLETSHQDLDVRKTELDEYSTRLDQRERKLKEQAALIKGIIKD